MYKLCFGFIGILVPRLGEVFFMTVPMIVCNLSYIIQHTNQKSIATTMWIKSQIIAIISDLSFIDLTQVSSYEELICEQSQ